MLQILNKIQCKILHLIHSLKNFFYQPGSKILRSVHPNKTLFNKNEYKGKRCFIIGNGPSLNNIDVSLLNGEYCFVVNKGYYLKDKGLRHVEFYGISDVYGYNEFGHLIPLDFAKHYCVIGTIPWSLHSDQTSFLSMYSHLAKRKYMSKGFMQFDLTKPLAHTYTIVLQMLQVAVYCGFTEIYFIGVDNNFSGPNMHFYPDSENEKINMRNWNFNPCPDTEKAFKNAYVILKKRGIKIFNAGVGGSLTSIPRVRLEDVLK